MSEIPPVPEEQVKDAISCPTVHRGVCARDAAQDGYGSSFSVLGWGGERKELYFGSWDY